MNAPVDKNEWNFESAETLLDVVLGFTYFHGRSGREPAIPFVRGERGRGRLIVVVGENASGKSFFRRCVSGTCRRAAVECIHISMEGRSGDGSSFGGLRPFVYGDENEQSTGENSVGTVLGGIRTCEGREGPHVMVWDEPDLGLSDSWAAGMGEAIRDFAARPGAHTRAIVLVTHRRALLAPILESPHHYLHLGAVRAPKTLAAWFEQPILSRDISELAGESRKRWRAIEDILRERERAAAKEKTKP